MEVKEDREHVEMYVFFEIERMPWPLYSLSGKIGYNSERLPWVRYLELQCRCISLARKGFRTVLRVLLSPVGR